jgi:hypothetical protein
LHHNGGGSNNAIPVAAKLPLARLGSIEVRPIEELKSSSGDERMQ